MGDRKNLIAPLWSLKKIDVLNSIQKELKKRSSFQGKTIRRVDNMKGLAEIRNKEIKVPHLNIFKIGAWVTMGIFASFLLIYIFLGNEIINYFPILIIFAFATPFISLMMSKASVKEHIRSFNRRKFC